MPTKVGYYPGCTLKTKARNLEDSALASLDALGVEAVELPRWNCCGAVFSLSDDDLIHHVAPVRDLIRAKDAGHEQLVTLCSLCYNTLARANLLMREDEEKRRTLNLFMDEESDYAGEVEVLHYLDFLDREVGWDRVAAAVKRPLAGLRVAPYYGCTLLRPEAVSIEAPGPPALFRRLIEALGAEPASFADESTCCGSYQILNNEKGVLQTCGAILRSANRARADALILSCPVCEYNLGRRQPDVIAAAGAELTPVPTVYFTQLLALALGLPAEAVGLKLNEPAAAELLGAKGLMDLDESEAAQPA